MMIPLRAGYLFQQPLPCARKLQVQHCVQQLALVDILLVLQPFLGVRKLDRLSTNSTDTEFSMLQPASSPSHSLSKSTLAAAASASHPDPRRRVLVTEDGDGLPCPNAGTVDAPVYSGTLMLAGELSPKQLTHPMLLLGARESPLPTQHRHLRVQL